MILGPLAAGLGGCGFRPLYGRRPAGTGTVVEELAAIRIRPLPDRVGQMLHNHLRDQINPDGQPVTGRYLLKVDYDESTRRLGVRLDETASRAELGASADFELVRIGEDEPLLSGGAQASVAYNIVDSEFATYSAEQDARERTVIHLAQEIRRRLAVYFRTQAADAE